MVLCVSCSLLDVAQSSISELHPIRGSVRLINVENRGMVIPKTRPKPTYRARVSGRWCVFAMMKLKVRIETDEWIYEEHEMQ